MSTFLCNFFHKWSKWSDPKPGMVKYEGLFLNTGWEETYIQRRHCERCGKQEVREAQ